MQGEVAGMIIQQSHRMNEAGEVLTKDTKGMQKECELKD